MGWLTGLLTGGSDEIGWDDLVRRCVGTIAGVAHHGARGAVAFPAEVSVLVAVPAASVEVVQSFVDDLGFDREVGAALANRFDVAVAELPVRQYNVIAAERVAVTATEAAPRSWQLTIEGGDLDGHMLSLPPGTSDLSFGRGEWHGGDQQVRNDLVVCERTEFVSRRAGRLFRAGHHLELAALDQGDLLLVRRPTGDVLRPARTARGRVLVRAGDVIELADGNGATVRLHARRVVAS